MCGGMGYHCFKGMLCIAGMRWCYCLAGVGWCCRSMMQGGAVYEGAKKDLNESRKIEITNN